MPGSPFNPFDVFRLPTTLRPVPSDAPSIGKGTQQQRPDEPALEKPQDREPTTAEQRHAREFADRLQRYPPGPAYPRPTQLYDNLRSRDAWQHVVTNVAHGSWIVGTTTAQPITFDNTPNPGSFHLDQFPKGTHAYYALLVFSYAPSVVTATGEFSWVMTLNNGGISYPLGEYTASQAVYNRPEHILEAPITDPGNPNVGTLIVTGNSITGTPTLFWRMGFGYVYFLPEPSRHGYGLYEGESQSQHMQHARRQ